MIPWWLLRAHTRQAEAERSRAGVVTLLDANSRRVATPTGVAVVSPKEWALLSVLLASPGVAVSRERLLSEVRGEGSSGSPRVVDGQVAALRRKLGAGVRIEAVRGVGYRYQPGDSEPR